MINLFIDTEFTCLNIREMKPISIGFVDQTGQNCFYAEFADTYRVEDCHPFTVANVLPYLRHGIYQMNISDARNRLYDYFASFNTDIKIWSDTFDWDRVVMFDIFPSNQDNIWPPRVSQNFGKLFYIGKDAVKFNNTLKDVFSTKRSSFRDKHVGRQLYQHNALDDAIANYLGWLAVGKKFQSEEVYYK